MSPCFTLQKSSRMIRVSANNRGLHYCRATSRLAFELSLPFNSKVLQPRHSARRYLGFYWFGDSDTGIRAAQNYGCIASEYWETLQ